MSRQNLTDAAVRALKPRETLYKVSDGQGLFVAVRPTGARQWHLAYRFDGKQKTLAIGAYPAVGLAAARAARDAAKAKIAAGLDPAAVKREERLRATSDAASTFRACAGRWLAAQAAHWTPLHLARITRRLEADVYPEIGAPQVASIDAPALLDMLRKVEARGALSIAKRIKNHCGEVLRFAIAEGRATADPTLGIGKALMRSPRVRRQARLAESEMPSFFAALGRYPIEERTRLALLLTITTMVRTNETRFAARSEFEGLDGAEPLWRIPAARMKMKREHLVPLSPQAVALVRRVLAMSDGDDLLFASDSKKGVMSENTMLYTLYRLGYHSRATVHGFRGTASTLLNERGFNQDWIELQLAHVPGDDVRAAYNAAQYLPGRRAMLCWWADWLDMQREIGELVG